MSSNKTFFFLAVSLFSLCSCINMKPLQLQRTENFTVTRSDGDPQFNFNLLFHNPNNFGFRVKSIESDVLIGEHPVVFAHINQQLRIKRESDFTIPVSAVASVTTLVSIMAMNINDLLNTKIMTATIRGNIVVKKFIFKKKFSFEYKQKVDSKLLKGFH